MPLKEDKLTAATDHKIVMRMHQIKKVKGKCGEALRRTVIEVN